MKKKSGQEKDDRVLAQFCLRLQKNWWPAKDFPVKVIHVLSVVIIFAVDSVLNFIDCRCCRCCPSYCCCGSWFLFFVNAAVLFVILNFKSKLEAIVLQSRISIFTQYYQVLHLNFGKKIYTVG